jgi:hypothetical protein
VNQRYLLIDKLSRMLIVTEKVMPEHYMLTWAPLSVG